MQGILQLFIFVFKFVLGDWQVLGLRHRVGLYVRGCQVQRATGPWQ